MCIRIFAVILIKCIFLVDGKSIRSIRYEQVGVVNPHIPIEAIPDDSQDSDHYYVLDYDLVESRIAVFDSWYNGTDMSMEATYNKGLKWSPERQLPQTPQLNHTSRKLLQNLESVVGFTDEREWVPNTQMYPFNTIGLIRINSQPFCTGALISDRVVLTAAHCLWDKKRGDFYSGITFSPGETAYLKPYGEYDVRYMSVKTAYTEFNDEQDFGVMLLYDDPPVGNMGWGYSCSKTSFYLNIAGYPGDLNIGVLRDLFGWNMFFEDCSNTYINMCPFTFFNDGTYDVEHYCDTNGGMSGAPMWEYNSLTGERTIRAIHYQGASSRYSHNTATAITPFVYDFILDKMDDWGQ